MEYPGRVVKLGEADASVVQAVRGQFNRMMAGESNLDPQGTAFDADMKRVVKLFQARHVVPWCCAFVYYCFDKASKKLGRPKNPMVRTAGCLDHWNKAPSRGAARIRAAEATDDPTLVKPGMIFIMDHGKGRGHTGLVDAVEAGMLSTIEGNTDASKTREGGGVYRLTRKVGEINKGFIDYTSVG